ncbi:GIY-YIG nuclease family protein [Profundibacter sp.]
MDPKVFRKSALSSLTNETGVYALCDLDMVPIYVGQSVDGIRARVQRHLTSARSDIIANRQIDVWEICAVMAWPVLHLDRIEAVENHLFHKFDKETPLMNGKIPPIQPALGFDLPLPQLVDVMDATERSKRLDPALRLPRQIEQYQRLVDYIQNVKDAAHLKRSLQAHFQRLVKYHNYFLA